MSSDMVTADEKKDSMVTEFRFFIPGDPIPLQRHRHGNGRTWDPQKDKKEELRRQLQVYHRHHPTFDGPIHLDILFYMPISKSVSHIRARKKEGTPHFIKPDLSNLIKFFEDTFNELLYVDDARIYTITASKLYSNRPRTEATLRKL